MERIKEGEMKNNNGSGLYNIGERQNLQCGCVIVAEEIGYTHYVSPGCKYDNRIYPEMKGYNYKPLSFIEKVK